MTVGMSQLNQMFRDFKVAEDVAKMMEMRRFEVEFTVYGSLFIDNGQRRYIISNSKDQILDFGEQRINLDKLLFPMIRHTKMTTVPAGCEEDIAELVKIELASRLRESYAEAFVQRFTQLAAVDAEDSAAPLLDSLAERMQGLYRPDNLLLFEGLMDRALARKCLRHDTGASYEAWLEQERQEMAGDPVPKERFQKILYGMACRDVSGNIKVFYNAEKNKIHEKKAQLMAQGSLTTPIYARNYWYNYDKTLQDVRREFGQHLQIIFDERYFAYLEQIEALPSVVNQAAFEGLVNSCRQHYGSDALAVMEQYRLRWGLVPLA